MKKILFTFLFILSFTFSLNAQVKGSVTGTNNEKLTNVNIYLADTYKGTTSNTNGLYELNISKIGDYTIVFQYLGYKTLKKQILVEKLPYILDVTLEESEISLDEVNINTKVDPAIVIVKNTIAQQKQNLSRLKEYTCDFYSKGICSIKNAPKKMFGQDLDDFLVGLDSARNGIIYLSESMSKIKFKAPNKFKEHMIASKVSGQSQGFSFNSASDFNFSFYKNSIELENSEVISPLAKYGFSYYEYSLVDLFYEDGVAINKIKVTPKRALDKVFQGHIYIVDEQWELYGVDLKINGKQLQSLAFKELIIKQNFRNDPNQNFWTMISQSLDFKFKFLKLEGFGTFTAFYSNYNFNPNFEKNSFNKEVLLVEKGANKKKDSFWEKNRPIQLTTIEKKDYQYKDSIQVIRESKEYLDSIDHKNNKFKFGDLLLGYNHRNSYKNWSWGIQSPLFAIQYNTVQGWNSDINLYYSKWNKEKGSRSRLSSKINYGLSDKKLRLSGSFYKMFNNFSKPVLQISGGRKLNQFNNSEPIKPIENSISTLFFEDNYAKFYDNTFGKITYGNEFFNGFRAALTSSYEKRKSVSNTTDFVIINNENKNYSSNNPLSPNDFSKGFETHTIGKIKLDFKYQIGQEYSTYPNGKYNSYYNDKPILKIGLESALIASSSNYKYNKFTGEIAQNKIFSNKGEFRYNLSGGLFTGAENISFIDFNHFNGNQIHFTQNNNLKKFALLPYYTLSTNENYAELHIEHNFKGYLLGKVPLLNKLNFNLVLSSHIAFFENNKPYSEYAIGLDNVGWGKVRFLRVDLVKSFHHGISEIGLMFGLKLN